jgi:hypothetical protein
MISTIRQLMKGELPAIAAVSGSRSGAPDGKVSSAMTTMLATSA